MKMILIKENNQLCIDCSNIFLMYKRDIEGNIGDPDIPFDEPREAEYKIIYKTMSGYESDFTFFTKEQRDTIYDYILKMKGAFQ